MSKQYIVKNGRSVEVSDEVYEILKRSDRRIKYVEKDLKETRYIINQKKATVKEIPSREDSLDRLTEIGKDFADSNSDFQDSMVLKIMLDEALAKLSGEERYLITQLFYLGRTERDLANELGISQYTVNRNKHKILKKLREEIGG